MINSYKRLVLWQFNVLSGIPGLKRYGRFMHKQYSNRFWTFWTLNMGIAVGLNVWLNRWIRKQEKAQRREKSWDEIGSLLKRPSPTKDIMDGIINPSFDHMKCGCEFCVVDGTPTGWCD